MDNIVRTYQCPACGESIKVTLQPINDPRRFGYDGQIEHPQPMDAACRLCVEALADEERARTTATVQWLADQLPRGQYGPTADYGQD